MTDPTQQDRLAALAARRGQRRPTPTPEPPGHATPGVATTPAKPAVDEAARERLAALTAKRESRPAPVPASERSQPAAQAQPAARGTTPRPSDPTGPSTRFRRPNAPSTTRLVTTGASIVSFAAMVVAMGPLTADAAENNDQPEPVVDDLQAAPPIPDRPEVVIEVIPNYVNADGTPLAPDELAFISDETSPEPASVEANVLSTQPATAPTAPAAAPAAAPPQPAEAPTPSPTAAPAAAAPAPTTAPPVAPAPTTAPPTTAPPTTAAPEPAPQPTSPPRSEASG